MTPTPQALATTGICLVVASVSSARRSPRRGYVLLRYSEQSERQVLTAWFLVRGPIVLGLLFGTYVFGILGVV